MSLNHYRTGSRRHDLDQSDQSSQNYRQEYRTGQADATTHDDNGTGGNARGTDSGDRYAGGEVAGRPVTGGYFDPLGSTDYTRNADSEGQDRARQGQHVPDTNTGMLNPINLPDTDWHHSSPHLSADNTLPAFGSMFGTASQSPYPPTLNFGGQGNFQPVDHSGNFQYTIDRQNYQPPAPIEPQNVYHRENRRTNNSQLPPVKASNYSELRLLSPVETPRETRAPSSGLANKSQSQEIEMQRQDSAHRVPDSIATQHLQQSFQNLPPIMQPNQRYPSSAQYGTSQISVAALRHPEHAQRSEGRMYQEEQMPLEFRAICRHPFCVALIHVNAPLGACNIHRDELSDWDFSYCEAEMRDCDRNDGNSFFPNGQCIGKSRQRFCHNHSSKNYTYRKLFQESEEAKEGKWFDGRHKGTAPFPAVYGTSGRAPYMQRGGITSARNLRVPGFH
ncbi:hypothetical protein EAF04_010841 [Stromatinia cepivora]|nr:hypothetical protein EAF04_010841 [Stromatinia cepivora]